MLTKFIIGFVVLLVVVASVDTMHVLAGSSKNPYSGFNISGINYGAQQWDRQHGKLSGSNSSGKTYYRRYRRR